MIPADPIEREAFAGEFVLGVLDPAEIREVERAIGNDASLRSAIVFWEEALHPLSALASPIDPPAAVWAEIARRIGYPAVEGGVGGPGGSAGSPGGAARANSVVAFWRNAAFAATAIAAGLLLYIALPNPSPAPVRNPAATAALPTPQLVAILRPATKDAPAFVATGAPGRLKLRAVSAQTLPAGRDLELWAIDPGASRPRPLGVIQALGATEVAIPVEVTAGTTLAISIEPKGGSTTGLPTGPVIFTGPVVQAS